MHLKWQTIARHGSGIEIEEAKQKIAELQGLRTTKPTKHKFGGDWGRNITSKKGKDVSVDGCDLGECVQIRGFHRLWAMPLVGATDY